MRSKNCASRYRIWSECMEIRPVNIGFGDIVFAGRIVAIVAPTSASAKRMVQDARDAGRLVDATYKRRTRAVIVTDSGHIVLSALQPETLANRVGGEKEDAE
ncbi:hypothetical protein HMPREF9162_0977 [Selenomonas sp. oral taxon 137 str. F0430]|nr:hypothetical protein HMPREF9162_0977 [Selenomonas sp. oral taxon 137 str. F0430]